MTLTKLLLGNAALARFRQHTLLIQPKRFNPTPQMLCLQWSLHYHPASFTMTMHINIQRLNKKLVLKNNGLLIIYFYSVARTCCLWRAGSNCFVTGFHFDHCRQRISVGTRVIDECYLSILSARKAGLPRRCISTAIDLPIGSFLTSLPKSSTSLIAWFCMRKITSPRCMPPSFPAPLVTS